MIAEVIALSTNSAILGNTIIITSSGGEDVSSTSVSWSCNGSSGVANLGNFTFTDSTFEPLSPNSDVMTVTFTLTSTFSDGTTGTSEATCSVTIPNSYDPQIWISSVSSNNHYNGHVRAGANSVATYNFTIQQEGSATHEVSVLDVVCNAPTICTIEDNSIRFTLPSINAESYTLSFKIRITDSRGREYTSQVSSSLLGTIYCYDAPAILITSSFRCDESGNEKVNGLYAKIIGTITDSSTLYSFKVNGIEVPLTSFNFEVITGDGKLDLGKKYLIPVSYVSSYMNENGYSAISVNAEIEAQRVPVSFIDNGYLVGISIGEMAQKYDDVTSDVVANFGVGCIMRGTNENGESITEEAYNVVMARNYIMNKILGGLSFVSLSESEYNSLRDKDGNTVYIVY